MYTTTMTIRLKPGAMNTVLSMFEEIIHDTRKTLPGFMGMDFLVSEEENMITEVTHWDCENCANDAFKSEFAQKMFSTFSSYMSHPPTIIGYNHTMHINPRELAGVM